MVAKAPEPQPWHSLKLATVYHCMGDRRMAMQAVCEAVALLWAGGEAGRGSEGAGGRGEAGAQGLTWPTGRQRHLRFLPLTRAGVLAYSCRLVTVLLQVRGLVWGTGRGVLYSGF